MHDDTPDASSRFAALERAFEEASALQGPARDAWLAQLAHQDPALAGELRAMLAANDAPGVMDAIGGRLRSVRDVVESAEAAIPSRIGPYVVDREIGRGGMGIVMHARDPRLQRSVAIKIFPHAAASPGETEGERRLVAEARAASALDHANICTIYDVGALPDGRPFLAMAYYPGGTLADRLAQGALPPREAREIAIQLADALAVAHAAGIVHRDVKPRNVAFGDRGEAVDARADVWALGVVLFEMLAGHRPFVGESTAELHRAITDTPAPSLLDVREEIPADLAHLVSLALRKTPSERPPHAGELAVALRAVRSSQAVAPRERAGASAPAPPPPPPPAAGRRIVMRRAGIAAVLVFVFGGTAVGALAYFNSRGIAAVDPAFNHLPEEPTTRAAFLRAQQLMRLGDMVGLEEAIALLDTVTAREPKHAYGHAYLARALVRAVEPGGQRESERRWIDSAMLHARRSIGLEPHLPQGYAALGSALAAQGRHEEAVAQFALALERERGNAYAMFGLGRSYLALDRPADGFLWLERALAADPGFPHARATIVSRYRIYDLPELAHRHIDRGLAQSPTENALQWERVLLQLTDGDLPAARATLARYFTLLSPAEQARMSAWFALLSGDLPEARRWVDRVVGTGTASYDRRMYGEVLSLTGDRTRGDSLLRLEVARLKSGELRAGNVPRNEAFALSYLHAALGEREEAMRGLAQWDAGGGLRSWRVLHMEYGWRSVKDDPRFRAIVLRSHHRLDSARARVVARLRTEGLLPSDVVIPQLLPVPVVR